MPTFGFDKPIDDIEPAVLLPEEWYQFEIMKDPEIKPNAKLRDELSDNPTPDEINQKIGEVEGGGMNMVLSLETRSADDALDGRAMTLWLPWPSEKDHDKTDRHGQKEYDAKMERIIEFTFAFGGAAEGDNISLAKGLQGMCYVVQRAGLGGDLENSIDMFQGFGAVE